MSTVAVIIPTMGRPDSIRRTIENLKETAPAARPHFVIEADDIDSAEAVGKRKHTAGDFGTYARCINAGWRDCPERILMTSDDDCVYHAGWLPAALKLMKGDVRVVGTNDLGNPQVLAGEHSTHSLVDRRYIEQVGAVADEGPGSFMFEYDHNYTDAELIETAKARGVFAPCLDSVVEHIHPDYGGRDPDPTWEKTRRAVAQDYATFCERRHLWEAR